MHCARYALPVSTGPSADHVCELMRQGAKIIANGSQGWPDELYDSMLRSGYLQTIADDPVLVETMRRCNRSNQLHWAAANISRPGEPVSADLGLETLALIRDLLSRGMGEAAVVDAYRIGHNVAWRAWMSTVFALTSDVDELRELLDVSALSIASFIDTTVAGVLEQMQVQRSETILGAHAERRGLVALILDGASTTSSPHTESRLGYRLRQSHTAAVVWSDKSGVDQSTLDRAVEALVRGGNGRRSLTVQASPTSRWVWVAGSEGLDLATVTGAVAQLSGVRIAMGSPATGTEGFRTSHFDAIQTQRMMDRLGSTQQVATFADVELVGLITSDLERANRFIQHTLGDFESADIDLQRAVLTFIREQCNVSQAAERLFAHRNTLLRKLARADELLPRPLKECSAHVAVALEALSWRDAREPAAAVR